MAIHFDDPVDKLGLRLVSGKTPENSGISKKRVSESDSFFCHLKKVSENTVKSSIIPQDQSKSAFKAQKALELCQRMKQQMNESLLRVMSDTEGENTTENSFMETLIEILPRQEKAAPLLSRIPQVVSETRQPEVQTDDKGMEKKVETDKNNSGDHDIEGIIQKASSLYGVDSSLIRDVIEAESNFKPDAVSPKGAMGLMQLMPGTARELGVTDPLDPAENIMAGTRYLKKLLDRYDGSVPHALAAYNWGMGNLDSRRSRMPAETRNYVAKITGVSFS